MKFKYAWIRKEHEGGRGGYPVRSKADRPRQVQEMPGRDSRGGHSGDQQDHH